jgi:hypothetical protein
MASTSCAANMSLHSEYSRWLRYALCREAEAVRAALIARSPEYKALLSGWEDTEVTPNDL